MKLRSLGLLGVGKSKLGAKVIEALNAGWMRAYEKIPIFQFDFPDSRTITGEEFCSSLFVVARKKISTTVYLTAEQVHALKNLHERTRVPIAEFIRMGIDSILERYSDQLPGQITLFDLNSVPTKPKNSDDDSESK